MTTSNQWGDELSDHGKIEKTCRFFNSFRGCKNGDQCSFVHEKLPCAFFTSVQGCTYNEKCPFSHDVSDVSIVQLKNCPNQNCQNQCIGRQCMQCHNIMDRVKQNKNKHTTRRSSPYSKNNIGYNRSTQSTRTNDGNVHICPEENCENTCTGRRCRECHFRNRR
jgi:hypothetical protein